MMMSSGHGVRAFDDGAVMVLVMVMVLLGLVWRW